MAKTKKTAFVSEREALLTFDLKAYKKWMSKYSYLLYKQFSQSNETVQMATMCKRICDRTDLLATEAHKKAVQWLHEHNMKGRMF